MLLPERKKKMLAGGNSQFGKTPRELFPFLTGELACCWNIFQSSYHLLVAAWSSEAMQWSYTPWIVPTDARGRRRYWMSPSSSEILWLVAGRCSRRWRGSDSIDGGDEHLPGDTCSCRVAGLRSFWTVRCGWDMMWMGHDVVVVVDV